MLSQPAVFGEEAGRRSYHETVSRAVEPSTAYDSDYVCPVVADHVFPDPILAAACNGKVNVVLQRRRPEDCMWLTMSWTAQPHAVEATPAKRPIVFESAA